MLKHNAKKYFLIQFCVVRRTVFSSQTGIFRASPSAAPAASSGCVGWSWSGPSKWGGGTCHQGHQLRPLSRSSSRRNNSAKDCVCDIQTPLPIQLVIYMNEILKNKAEDERSVCPSFPSVSIRRSFDLCFPGSLLQEQPQLFH